MGPVVVLKKNDYQVKRTRIEDPEAEIKRVDEALEKSKEQLQKLYDKAVQEVGEASAAIFEVHQMMLEDDDYLEAIQNTIRTEQINAEYAVAATGDNFAEMFASMDDDYMKARSADIKDISERLVRNLSGQDDADLSSIEPSIIVADDLSPSETVQMDKDKILAFVTVHGSTNSHTAILARMMNIPALIGVDMNLEEIHTGMEAVVDGFQGTVIFEPDETVKAQTTEKMAEEAEKLRLLQELKGKENVTLDGHKINIYANIGSVGDIGYVMENDAGGIGLFRSEFLYLGRNDFPTEEEQFQAYKQAVQMMAGKKVIIRTLDIGADKQVDYFNLGNEDNPAMGYRAIRICLKQPEIFKTQLRALLRAAVYGNLSIMYPMITSTEEVKKIYEIVAEVEEELKAQEIQYKIPEQGIMIETPAAAIISDRLAEMVDFFSIGTNDLTQYTLAIDRQNEKLDEFYNPHHEALLRMIQMVVDNAHKCGKWAGICGELGADTTLTEEFVRMGLDELSVAPSMVLKLRKIVREMKVEG
jgi:phosphotransferase system enzyme I (PtsI)